MSGDEDPLNARVAGAWALAPGRHLLRVTRESGEAPAFEPGQYTILGLPARPGDPEAGRGGRRGLVRRTYSMSSSAHRREWLEFYFVAVSGGRLSPRLGALEVGERLYLDPRPRGALTLASVPADRDVVLVATGTAIAPYVSMVRTYLGTGRLRRLALLHGVRERRELAFHDELAAAEREENGFAYRPICSREPEHGPWRGPRGHVQDLLEAGRLERETGIRLDPGPAHVFLAGNPAMIDDVQEALTARGFTPDTAREAGTLHTERYW